MIRQAADRSIGLGDDVTDGALRVDAADQHADANRPARRRSPRHAGADPSGHRLPQGRQRLRATGAAKTFIATRYPEQADS